MSANPGSSLKERVSVTSLDRASDTCGASARSLVRVISLVMDSVRVVESDAVLISVRLRSRVSVRVAVSVTLLT